MRRYLWVVFMLLAALVQQSYASESADVKGTWRLLAMEVEVQSTGEMLYPLGKNPTGYAIFSDSRVWFVLTGEGRKPAKTVEDKAALFESLLAYSGKYRLEGDKWITSVEVAWNPAWIGTEQSRTFKVEGDHLKVITPWRVMPNWADKGMTRSINTFEIVK